MNPISSWNAFAKPRTSPSLRPWIQWLRIQSFLSHFYIKPQRTWVYQNDRLIASYLISTSNHNLPATLKESYQLLLISFLHQTTTGLIPPNKKKYCFLSHFYIKPQLSAVPAADDSIASYLISTSNHNHPVLRHATAALLLISFLHQTTTFYLYIIIFNLLLLISFLHQTTTKFVAWTSPFNCFLSHFYIKPQPFLFVRFVVLDCFLSHFYIKPQPLYHI